MPAARERREARLVTFAAPKGFTRSRSCALKIPHPTLERAQYHADRLNGRGLGDTWAVYECRFGGHFHVGRAPRRRAWSMAQVFALDGGSAVGELGVRVVAQIVQENSGSPEARIFWITKRAEAAARRSRV